MMSNKWGNKGEVLNLKVKMKSMITITMARIKQERKKVENVVNETI